MATIENSINQVAQFTYMIDEAIVSLDEAEKASEKFSRTVEEAIDLSTIMAIMAMDVEPIQRAVEETETLQAALANVSMDGFNSEVEESCRLLEQLSQVSFEDAYNVEIAKAFSEEDKTDAKKIADMETKAAERASPPKGSRVPEPPSVVKDGGHVPQVSTAVEEGHMPEPSSAAGEGHVPQGSPEEDTSGSAVAEGTAAVSEQFEKNKETFEKLNGILGNSAPTAFFDNVKGQMADAVQNSTMLSDVMNGTLMAIMGSEGAQNLFGGMLSDMAGLTSATEVFDAAFNGVFPYIEPVIMGIQAALALYQGYLKMTEIATSLLGKESAITNAIMAACPIILIISLIVGLILAILAIVATFEPVRTGIANFMRAVGSIFSGGVGFVIDLFAGLANTVIGIINKILGFVNDLINTVGDVLGIESEVSMELQEIDASAFKDKVTMGIETGFDMAATATENLDFENIKATIGLDKIEEQTQQSDLEAEQKEHMEKQKQHYSTQENHYAAQEGYMSTTASALTGDDGLSGEVEVSPDDAELMRQIAEAKSVQNFVTMTPTVDVKTGDIREEADVDKLVDKITAVLVEDVAISAEGAYA